MRRLLLSLSAVALVSGFIATPTASAQQSFNFYLGGFVPRPLDERGTTNRFGVSDDVLVANSAFLSTFNRNNGIDIGKFNGATVGGEWLFGMGRNFEGGLGLGFYQRSVATSYSDLVNANGSEIAQTLKLRIVPFTATFRFLPFGHDQPIQPYIGAGVGVYGFRYSEAGQFVDGANNVFSGNFAGSGSAVGPVVVGGVRIQSGVVSPGFEIRYQSAEGKLPADQDFAGSKIDLGGMNYLFTLNIKF
ncbi:MAG: hypothetical protein ABUS56_06855 [Acidobacteriota bacterium]